jgi:hypothetical protein
MALCLRQRGSIAWLTSDGSEKGDVLNLLADGSHRLYSCLIKPDDSSS